MSLDKKLWTSWGEDWPARKDGEGCVFCAFVRDEDPGWGVRVHTGQVANGYLSVRGQIPGYCWVIWRDGHVCEPTQLDPVDAQRFFGDLITVGRAVERLLDPAKMNYQVLGNGVPHLHGHVIPRPHLDPSPNGPLSWDHLDAGRRPESEVRDFTTRLRALCSE